MNYKERIMATMLDLVSAPSVSGTEQEKLATEKIYTIVKEIPYFKAHSENLKQIEIKDDPLHRSFISALYLGNKDIKKTLILTGHSDVVDVEEFGNLKEFAFDPIEYTKRVQQLPLEEEALKDLQSGEWIFGRGTADMKYGIALEIEVLRKLSLDNTFQGNLLFIAVPGEESNSEGMLAAVAHIEKLQREGLEFIGLLLSECCIPKSAGEETKRLYLGSCGKVMPLFYFIGKEAHVCEPFNGVSPNILASELATLLEFNTEFCGFFKGETGISTTPPPVCLKQADLKELYSVQLPLYAYSYYNMLILEFSYETLVSALRDKCEEAFHNALEIMNKNRKQYEILTGTKIQDLTIAPIIMTYDELYKKVKEIQGSDFDKYINKKIRTWQVEKMDAQKIAVQIIRETYENYPNKSPMIILAFSPPYYPSRSLNKESEGGRHFIKAIDRVLEYGAEKYEVKIEKEDFFMGICDLCYTGAKEKELEQISPNILGLNKNYSFPLESLKKLDIPAVVFGGFGKDFHKYSERLHIPYSLEVVPELYEYLAYALFDTK